MSKHGAIYSTSSELLPPVDGGAAEPGSTDSIAIDQVQLEARLAGQVWFACRGGATDTYINYPRIPIWKNSWDFNLLAHRCPDWTLCLGNYTCQGV